PILRGNRHVAAFCIHGELLRKRFLTSARETATVIMDDRHALRRGCGPVNIAMQIHVTTLTENHILLNGAWINCLWLAECESCTGGCKKPSSVDQHGFFTSASARAVESSVGPSWDRRRGRAIKPLEGAVGVVILK